MFNRIKMVISRFKDVKFCPNCKVRMSAIHMDFEKAYITYECPCCKSVLMSNFIDFIEEVDE